MRIQELIIGTLQGEGSNSGLAVDFVRLHGCNVGCWFCDTGYSESMEYGANIPFKELSFEEIYIQLKSKNIGVLITDHNVRETLTITDRSYLLYNGQILKSGTTKDLIEDEEAKKLYLGTKFKMDY